MATFNKFEDFARALCEEEHLLDGTDTLKVYLTLNTPSASADTIFDDLAEINSGNGYTAGGEDTTNTGSETGGIYTVAGSALTWTATGGTIPSTGGGFRYVVLYNDSPTNNPLIGWWDYGSILTLNDGEAFGWHPGSSIFTVG